MYDVGIAYMHMEMYAWINVIHKIMFLKGEITLVRNGPIEHRWF